MTDFLIDKAIARLDEEEAPYRWYEGSPEEADTATIRGLTIHEYADSDEWYSDAEEKYADMLTEAEERRAEQSLGY